MSNFSDEKPILISLFEEGSLNKTSNFTIGGILLLYGDQMSSWSEIALSIFIWMAIPFLLYGICSSLISLFTLRKHPYICFVIIPFIFTTFLIPIVFGAPTSMIMAYAMSSSDRSVSPIICMLFGFLQTVLIFVVSITRLHATL